MAARLKEVYTKEIAPALMKKFEYKSVMQIPKFDKIVINVGAGDAKETPRLSTPSSLISRLSPVRRQFLHSQRSPLLTSSSVRA